MPPPTQLLSMSIEEADRLLRMGIVKFDDLFTQDWKTWYLKHEIDAKGRSDDSA